ncbi:A disintegrin and metalloproteinase with thrombospondin motifs adt-1-like [Condylostylus longicornis]|uniref:A disintegrin and metalloproteinase with thrombospondin motifs adt-1-like n=1 Tax=Condylostylus longicornis TaxID=2530218 RepID=UPI00244DD218|nr:A disintegrin and metalloproteinase with thrombospondin motifs adt-1-like [Condylostylus longicornis]
MFMHSGFNLTEHGLILTVDDTYEIKPLNTRLRDILRSQNDGEPIEYAHLVKRAIKPEIVPNLSRPVRSHPIKIETTEDINAFINTENVNFTLRTPSPQNSVNDARIIKKDAKYIVELGLFFDEAAYKAFSPLFNSDDRRLAQMILAYMNGVQALYHHSSLAYPVDITITRMEIMRRQPASLPAHGGERDNLLDSFCNYHMRMNSPRDTDQDHWDIGLYLSGLDFYAYEGGQRRAGTMGLATVRGVCSRQYSCVIVEFGATNSFGRPYPSAGFNSIYIAAHEIGHNLGMSHDGTGNQCSQDGYIMSASRGTQGETSWSTCSSDIIRNLGNWATCLNDRPPILPENYDAWKYLGYPGIKWSAKSQCEVLLVDRDAMASTTNNLDGICQNLQCRSPHRSGFFFSGPALEGTTCGNNFWCEGGYCVQRRKIPQQGPIIKGGWGPWVKGKCASGCMVHSKGGRTQRRECNNPKPVNTNEGCEGASYDMILCEDEHICRNVKRRTPVHYASNKCKQFSRHISEIDPKGVGLQAPYESNRLWMSCAIFCRRSGSDSFYTPRLELNEIGINAYFPDGTWCNSQGGQNYYCLQHHCLPENFQFNKHTFIDLSEDVPISGNANPSPLRSVTFSSKLIDYLSLDAKGKPIRTHITKEDVKELWAKEKGFKDNDFRFVPFL